MGAPDEFHDDAHPEAREITGDRQYGEWGQCVATATSTGNRCRGYAKGPHGKCRQHGGAEGSGAPEGNQNGLVHGAYAEHAIESLTEAEEKAFRDAAEKLEDPEDAQEIARNAASFCLIMGHRSGDDRWFRRWEGICDKFGIAPEDVQQLQVEHSGEVEHSGSVGLDEDTQEVLDDLTGGL